MYINEVIKKLRNKFVEIIDRKRRLLWERERH